MKKAIFLLFAICFMLPALAQDASQPAFNAAVDRINCETIRFIHREAGRAEIANNLECFTFESILKSIPEDEAGTTQKVSKDIEAYKGKFKQDKDLGAQIDEVIAYASKRIKAKPRKFNVGDYEKKLQEIKEEALANANPANENNAANTATTTENTNTGEDNDAVVLTNTDDETSDASTGPVNWLGWLSLFLSAAALIFAFLAYRRADAAINNGTTYVPVNDDTNRLKSDAAIKELENKMHTELQRMDRSIEDRLAAVTASTGYTAPEEVRPVSKTSYNAPAMAAVTPRPTVAPVVEADEFDDEEEEIVYAPTPVDQADAPDVTEVFEREAEAEVEESPEEEVISENNEHEEMMAEPEPEPEYEPGPEPEPEPVREERIVHTLEIDEDEQEYFENEEDITAETEEEQLPENEIPQNTIRSDASANFPPITHMPVEDDEDEAEGLPQYKYVGLPSAEGTFTDNDFSEVATAESAYEVEMYDDVPNKAFIAPLQTPDAVNRSVRNTSEILAPVCEFMNDPSGKSNFIVVEEGILRKQDDKWHIYQKARLRFD